MRTSEFIQRLESVRSFARDCGRVERDSHARRLWYDVYGELSAGRMGMVGALTSRAEAQVLRLSTLYAVLDCSSEVRVEHLNAALAVWKYAERSVAFIFGKHLGDPTADEILALLRQRTDGVTRTDIQAHFGRHKASSEITRACNALMAAGLATRDYEDTGGRRTEKWFCIGR